MGGIGQDVVRTDTGWKGLLLKSCFDVVKPMRASAPL